jgi:uncharacterized repeat protein (TIGR03803 family)
MRNQSSGNTKVPRIFLFKFATAATLALLVSCGGGGGGGANGTTTHNITGTETMLRSFGDAAYPYGNLLQASDGNLYGMTYSGESLGAVFKISPAGVETVLHSFAGGPGDGAYPFGSLIQASDGNLYGMTSGGGANGAGTVFMVTTAGTETMLWSFGGTGDGATPWGSLIQASDGNLYGLTSYGGANSVGSVIKISTDGTTVGTAETVLYSFAGGTGDGATPWGSLIQASDGKLYGLTSYGGTHDLGTVFGISTDGTAAGTTETVLHTFAGGTGDGANPQGSLIQASDGNLYGMTKSGGANGAGTVFGISTDGTAAGTTETVLHTFAGGTGDGASPNGDLIQASNGNLYGLTYAGGTNSLGTVFWISTDGTTVGTAETVLYSFAGGTGDGANPQFGSLIQASDGNLYGMGYTGGANNFGIVFKISTAGVETVLHSFLGAGGDGAHPDGDLVQASDGNFYGMTSYGGGAGAVIKISTAGVETVLHSFAGGTGDGATPWGSLIQASNGNLYGLTYAGGTHDLGTVIKISTAGTETMLWSFGGTGDGASPLGSLIQASDGNLYGMTKSGGANGAGTVFKISMAGDETMLWSFGGTDDGGLPAGNLIQASNGNLYGLTSYGGTHDLGTVFKISTDGTAVGTTETVLYSFGATGDGAYPEGSLIRASDGNLYGMTNYGDTHNLGNIFRISTDGTAAGTTETVLHTFAGGTDDGATPWGSLIQASDGNLYGLTYNGGADDLGTMFKISTAGIETVLHTFAGGAGDGGLPRGGLIQASDGNLYGLTSSGGANNLGTLFQVK